MKSWRIAGAAALAAGLVLGLGTTSAQAQYFDGHLVSSTNAHAEWDLSISQYGSHGVLQSVDLKADGYSSVAIIKQKKGANYVEFARVVNSKGSGTGNSVRTWKPPVGTKLELVSCRANLGAKTAAARAPRDCKKTFFTTTHGY